MVSIQSVRLAHEPLLPPGIDDQVDAYELDGGIGISCLKH